MNRLPSAFAAASLLLVSGSCVAAVRPHRHATTHALVHHSTASRGHHAERAAVERPSISISSERATEIQSALIQKGYLTGEPTGTWDSESMAAMQKLQGDNGWQTKIVPDSRALIKLGLGPGSNTALASASVPAEPVKVE